MHLYNTSLVRGGAAVCAVYGNFSGIPKAHEVVLNHGTWLELIRMDAQGEMQSIGMSETFSLVRSISSLRTAGANRDLLAVGSDSGKLSILEFSLAAGRFVKVKAETFGKSGVRRIVPGQYIAVDPAGRCLMVAAVEKQKLVFNLARDNESRLVVASPLEAHKANTLVFDLQALHVGLENPTFAAIEFDYSIPNGSRFIAIYEVEEGLNQVVRKSIQPTFHSANKIVPLPGGEDGPGGFFVCGEGQIQYQKVGQDVSKNPPIQVYLPTRVGNPQDRRVLIECVATSHRKSKGEINLWFLLQTEDGDLFRLVPRFDQESLSLDSFSLHYFDTCPVARSICITKRGFMFLASASGNHRCYQFKDVSGPHGNDIVVESSQPVDSGVYNAPIFAPRANKNLLICSSLPSLAPALSLKVAEMFGEPRSQMLVACGQGSRSSLQILRHGLEVTEVAVTDLGGKPSGVWTVRESESASALDKYIVVSFSGVTMVLSVGEASVEQATDSGLRTDVHTIAVQRLADGSIVQIHPTGLHRTGSATGWSTPPGKKIDCAAVNDRQILVALEGGQLVYFELDEANILQQQSHDFGADIRCIDLGELPKGRKRTPFFVIGPYSNSLQILSLDPANMFKQLTMQVLPDHPDSLLILEMSQQTGSTLKLCAGLRNGVLVQSSLDRVSGAIIDTKTRFLGTSSVKCVCVKLPTDPSQTNLQQPPVPESQNGLLALSSSPWLSYMYHGKTKTIPLSCQSLSSASNFNSTICDGVVAISDRSLRIFELESLGQNFNTKVFKLDFTPRKLLHHKLSGNVILIEGDHNTPAEEEQEAAWRALVQLHNEQYPDEEDGMPKNEIMIEDVDEMPKLCLEEVGLPKCTVGDQGRWACQIRVIDPISAQTKMKLSLDKNELCVSACFAKLWPEQEEFLVVGCVTSLHLHPQAHQASCLKVFRLVQGNLSLVHSTILENAAPPRACCAINGMLAVGVGNAVRVYAYGQSKLLLKAEVKCMPTAVTFIAANGNRLYVGDAHESVHILKFSSTSLTLAPFADDTIPRLTITGEVLDYDTVAASDKFGNLFVLRLPSDVGDGDVENITGDRMLWDQAKNSGAPNKLDLLCHYYVGEMVTGMQKAALVPGKAEALIYCTIMGSIGAFVPFGSKSDHEFFSLLEMHLRTHESALVGREHLPYRGYFSPVKGVIDGDLCQLFDTLPLEKQEVIAKELDRTPTEISKKISDFQNCLL